MPYDQFFVLQINMFVYQTIKITLYCNQQGIFQKKSFLKNFAPFTGKHLRCEYCFYKVTGLQPSGLQHRCFYVNNMKVLRTPILKNICQLLMSAFFKLILWNSWKKIHSTKYFIWRLHVAMNRNHWNVSLNLCYRHSYFKMCCFK